MQSSGYEAVAVSLSRRPLRATMVGPGNGPPYPHI